MPEDGNDLSRWEARNQLIKKLLGIFLAFAIAGPVLAAPNSDPFISSLTLNEQNPVQGQDITFTAVYPQDAARQSRQPQYPDNPSLQVDCYQQIDGLTYRVYSANQKMADKKKITGGWISQTYPVNLSANGGNGFYWQSGAASCSAILYSFDVNNQGHIWAQTEFDVGA